MNKRQFTEELAARTGRSKADSRKTIEVVMDILTEQMIARKKVQLFNFGTFEARLTPQRMARNLHTKEEIIIPARYRPFFKASKDLQNRVNGSDTP